MLATEMYKVSINFSPPHVNEIFEISNEHSYKLKQNSVFPTFSKIILSRNWKSFLFRAKSFEIYSQTFTKI